MTSRSGGSTLARLALIADRSLAGVGEHGEHPAVVFVGAGDADVGTAFGHRLEHLPLPRRHRGEGVVPPGRADQPYHHLGGGT